MNTSRFPNFREFMLLASEIDISRPPGFLSQTYSARRYVELYDLAERAWNSCGDQGPRIDSMVVAVTNEFIFNEEAGKLVAMTDTRFTCGALLRFKGPVIGFPLFAVHLTGTGMDAYVESKYWWTYVLPLQPKYL
jgi:hypothetical protein